MILPGEQQAVKIVLDFASMYGYGNLIAHLKRAWALHLMEVTPNLTYNQALLAADVDAYPKHFSIEYIASQAHPDLKER